MSLVPVLIFGPFLGLCAWIVIAICHAAKEPETDGERAQRELDAFYADDRHIVECVPLTEAESRELLVEAEAVTREAACHR